MNIQECAHEVGRSDQSVRRWIKAGYLVAQRKGFNEIYVDPVEWEKFCDIRGIHREAGKK